MALLLLLACGSDAPLPELSEVPAIRLTAQDGSAFDTSELRGKVWVAGFIFTTCPTVCPMTSTQMANLQRRIDDGRFRLVSFTVDPENDTPEVLQRYADNHGADTERWTFLTGPRDDLRRAIVDGMKMGMGERTASGDITHGTHLVLVDANGHIRGYYRTDGEGMENIERDARRLLDE